MQNRMESSNISSSRHLRKWEKHLCIHTQTNSERCTDEYHYHHCYRNLEVYFHIFFLKTVLFHNRKIFLRDDVVHKYTLFAALHFVHTFLSMLTNRLPSIRLDREFYCIPELIQAFALKIYI